MSDNYVPGQGFEVPVEHAGIDFTAIARRERMRAAGEWIQSCLGMVIDRFGPPVAMGALCILGTLGVAQASCVVGEGVPPATCRAFEDQADRIIGEVVKFVDPRPTPSDELPRQWQEGDYPVRPVGPPAGPQD